MFSYPMICQLFEHIHNFRMQNLVTVRCLAHKTEEKI